MKRRDLSFTHELIEQDAIFNYINGGNAIVTLESNTGVHRTYRFFKGFNDAISERAREIFEYIAPIEIIKKYIENQWKK